MDILSVIAIALSSFTIGYGLRPAINKLLSKNEYIDYLLKQEKISKKNAKLFYDKTEPKTKEEIIQSLSDFSMMAIQDLTKQIKSK